MPMKSPRERVLITISVRRSGGPIGFECREVGIAHSPLHLGLDDNAPAVMDGAVDLIFNTTEGWQSLKDSHSIRATALNRKVPYFTTAAASVAAGRAIEAVRTHALEVASLQAYYSASKS